MKLIKQKIILDTLILLTTTDNITANKIYTQQANSSEFPNSLKSRDMKTAGEYLKEKNITPETKHHNYDYLYHSVFGAIEQAQKDAFKEGQSSPKINRLEWIFYGTYYSAETPVIDYIITHENGFIVNEGECALWVNGFPISHSTLEEAKAAAQAHFEKRVMECLDIADNSNK